MEPSYIRIEVKYGRSVIPSAHEHEPIYRRNFIYFLLDNILFTLGITIVGPTTIIPDFIRRLTSSEVLIGLSSSLFDVGWTLPQLIISRIIVKAERKKWWFVLPNIPVRFVILAFAVITMLLGKNRPEAILVAFLICYGIAALGDGLVSVPWMVLAGTSLDGRWRARMFGLTSAIAGLDAGHFADWGCSQRADRRFRIIMPDLRRLRAVLCNLHSANPVRA
jgi:hypothetical protein